MPTPQIRVSILTALAALLLSSKRESLSNGFIIIRPPTRSSAVSKTTEHRRCYLLYEKAELHDDLLASRRRRRTALYAAAQSPVPNTTVQKESSSDASSQKSSSDRTKLPSPLLSTRFYAVQALVPNHLRAGKSGTNNNGRNGVQFAVDRLESSFAKQQHLSTRDRSFCRLLVTTVERRLGQIDKVLEACQTNNKKKKESTATARRGRKKLDDLWVQAALRIGAAQLLFLQTPAHAAVKETVETLRLLASSSDYSISIRISEPKIKYVNAVLRRLAREGRELLALNSDITDNAAPWLVQEFQEQWGEEATQQILKAAMVESPRCLTVNLLQQQQQQQQQNITDSTAAATDTTNAIQKVAALFPKTTILPQGSIRVEKPTPPGTLSTWPLYQQGAWWCQDPAATIPALALYQGVVQHQQQLCGNNTAGSMHVIDLCAAPGGKTAQLACNSYGLFDIVTAVEISARRSQRLEQNLVRLNIDNKSKVKMVVADGCVWTPEEPADAVLVDVPCTATGTASKRPDVLRRDSDYTELLTVQHALACHAADTMVKVGGILVYATCSLLKQESEDQVERLLLRGRDGNDIGAQLEMVPFQPGEIPGFDAAIDPDKGWMRVLPGVPDSTTNSNGLGQCDGFFVARMRRIS